MHTKLPILAAYPHLTMISITVARCEMQYWQFSVGLNQAASDLRRGVLVGCLTIAIEQHFY